MQILLLSAAIPHLLITCRLLQRLREAAKCGCVKDSLPQPQALSRQKSLVIGLCKQSLR